MCGGYLESEKDNCLEDGVGSASTALISEHLLHHLHLERETTGVEGDTLADETVDVVLVLRVSLVGESHHVREMHGSLADSVDQTESSLLEVVATDDLD